MATYAPSRESITQKIGRIFREARGISYTAAAAAMFTAFAAILLSWGREAICKCGYVKLWHGIVRSSENSQHLTDWYSPSHVIHGILFYALFRWVGKRWTLGARLLAALALEMAWELFENTNFVINRYRSATISLDYYGDSVVNSVSDVLLVAVGFFVARKLPVAAVVVLVIAMELFTVWYIRDNLTLNIIMLLYPFRAILNWQAGA